MAHENTADIEWTIAHVGKLMEGLEISSPIVIAGGFQWQLTAYKWNGGLHSILKCAEESEESSHWLCEALLEFSLTPHLTPYQTKREHFREAKNTVEALNVESTTLHPSRGFVSNDELTIRLRITVERATGIQSGPWAEFSQPGPKSDAVLLVEGRRLHVSKMFLSIHSPYFEAMFAAEKNRRIFTLEEDLKCEEMLELLRVIYPPQKGVTRSSVRHVLALAEKFAMKMATTRAEDYLITTNRVPLLQKLLLSEEYSLMRLRDNSVAVGDVHTIKAIETTHHFKLFSDELRDLIDRRLQNLRANEAQNGGISCMPTPQSSPSLGCGTPVECAIVDMELSPISNTDICYPCYLGSCRTHGMERIQGSSFEQASVLHSLLNE